MQALLSGIGIPVPHDEVPVLSVAGTHDSPLLGGLLPEPDYPAHPIMFTVLAHSLFLLIVPLYHVLSLSAPVIVIYFFIRPRLTSVFDDFDQGFSVLNVQAGSPASSSVLEKTVDVPLVHLPAENVKRIYTLVSCDSSAKFDVKLFCPRIGCFIYWVSLFSEHYKIP